MIAVFAAAWFALFAHSGAVRRARVATRPQAPRVGFFASYGLLVHDVGSCTGGPKPLHFLIASALYRDGLAAVFTFGAILAVSVYGMAQATVLIFGIVANVVAAIGALSVGAVEDRIGPKTVIMISLDRADHDLGDPAVRCMAPTMFWIFGLILCLWVGPAQSSSRAFMARLAPSGARARCSDCTRPPDGPPRSWRPALFALFSGLFSDRVGIVGIALVLLAGSWRWPE